MWVSHACSAVQVSSVGALGIFGGTWLREVMTSFNGGTPLDVRALRVVYPSVANVHARSVSGAIYRSVGDVRVYQRGVGGDGALSQHAGRGRCGHHHPQSTTLLREEFPAGRFVPSPRAPGPGRSSTALEGS